MEAQSWSEKLKIVTESSGHPSRCRWTAGERASSRDARDILVSELHLVSSLECRSQVVLEENRAASYIGEFGTSIVPTSVVVNLPRSLCDHCAQTLGIECRTW